MQILLEGESPTLNKVFPCYNYTSYLGIPGGRGELCFGEWKTLIFYYGEWRTDLNLVGEWRERSYPESEKEQKNHRKVELKT